MMRSFLRRLSPNSDIGQNTEQQKNFCFITIFAFPLYNVLNDKSYTCTFLEQAESCRVKGDAI